MPTECSFATCDAPGTLERRDIDEDVIRWYCEHHDPLEDDPVADLFEAVD